MQRRLSVPKSVRPWGTVAVGLALCSAAAMAAANQQTGANDFRISQMGMDGIPHQTGILARDPAVAYNATDDEYLVVWSGQDSGVYGREIYGQILAGATGLVVKDDFRISRMGPDADLLFLPQSPDVAWDSDHNRYLVVWSSDDLTNNEYEIFGQSLDEDGNEIGFDDFRISQMGPDGDIDFAARFPSVAYNPVVGEFLVVWEGDHDQDPEDGLPGPLVNDHFEIWAQRVDDGFPIVLDFDPVRVSTTCCFGSGDALRPDVVANVVDNEYLVVWQASTPGFGTEILGRRLSGAGATKLGTTKFVSELDSPAETHRALDPAIAFNANENEYLVVWEGEGVPNEWEIRGQRLSGSAAANIGGNDFRLSWIGATGDADRDASSPAVAYSSVAREYVVAFQADDNFLVDNEYEIHLQYLDGATGRRTGSPAERISSMGSGVVFDNLYDAYAPALAVNSISGQFLAVWFGDDPAGGLVNDEWEIYGQRLLPLGELLVDGFEEELCDAVFIWQWTPALVLECPYD